MRRRPASITMGVAFLAAALAAGAATWNGGGASDVWSVVDNWGGVAPTNDEALTFSGASRLANTNDALTSAGVLTFTSSGFAISGNALTLNGDLNNSIGGGTTTWNINSTLGGARTFTTASGGSLAFNGTLNNNGNLLTIDGAGNTTLGGALSGAGNLAKSGAGTLILGANNSFGATIINAGTVQVGNAGSAGTLGSGDVTNNANLLIKRNGLTLGNKIGGSGNLTVELNADGDFLYLSNSGNDYTGRTTLRRGTVQIASENSLGATPASLVTDSIIMDGGKLQGYQGNKTLSATRGITINAGKNGYFYVWTGYDLLVNGPVSGAGALVKQDGGRLILAGTNTYAGATTVENGTIQIGNGGASGTLGSGDVSISAGKTLAVNRTDSVTFNNRITGDGATANTLVMNGSGTLTLGGSADNSGLVATVNTGTLVLGKASSGGVHALGAGGTGLIVNNGGTARLGGTGGDQLYTQLDVTINSGGTFDLNGLSEGFDGLMLNTGGVVTNTQSAVNSTILVGENNAGSTLAGTVAGNANLQKAGSGTVTVNGPQAYSGWTHLQAGNLTLGGDNVLPDSTIVIAWGGAGTFSVGGRTDTIRSLSVGSDPDNAPILDLGVGGRLTVAGNDIVASKVGTYTYAKWAGRIRGLGNVTYSNTASATGLWDWLNGGNDFSGSVTIARGRLRIRSPSNALDSAFGFATNIVFDGAPVATLGNQEGTASLQVENGVNLTLGAGRTVTLNAGREGTMYVWGGTVGAVDGKITGGGSLRKEDSGVLLLNNTNNDYAGATKVVFGTLRLGANEVLPNTTVVTLGGSSGGPTLDLNGKTETIAGLIDGGVLNGSVSGGGTLRVAGGGSYSYGGTFNGSLLVVAGSGTQILAGAADNNSGVAQVDSGTLVLAKSSSSGVHAIGSDATGLTINSGGTARLGGTGGDQLYQNTDVVLNNGGTFDLAGRSEGFDALSGGGTVTSSEAGSPVLTLGQNNGSSAFSGVLQNGMGVLGLTKAGTGKLTLSGNSTYSGLTLVQGGTLAFSGAGSISNSPVVNISAGATVDVSAASGFALVSGQQLQGDGTVVGPLSFAAATLSPGNSAGTLTFGGNVAMDSASAYAVELFNVGVTNGDRIVMLTSTLTLNNPSLNLVLGPGYASQILGPVYEIVSGSYAGAGFAGLPVGTNVFSQAGLDWRITYAPGGIYLQEVPEPGSAVLFALAAGWLLRRRRG